MKSAKKRQKDHVAVCKAETRGAHPYATLYRLFANERKQIVHVGRGGPGKHDIDLLRESRLP